MAQLDLGRGHAGQAHRVAPGDVVVIRLPETPTSGYRWAVDAYDPQVLRLAGDDFHPPAPARPGAGGEREFRFAAEQVGSTAVRLARRRAWESAAAAAERFDTIIEVDGAERRG